MEAPATWILCIWCHHAFTAACLRVWLLQLLLEAQQLQDEVLEAGCRMAVTANRLVRLDNPIAAAHLAAMQACCISVFSSSCINEMTNAYADYLAWPLACTARADRGIASW